MVWTSIEGLASSHKVWHLVLAEAALLCQTSVILRNSMLALSGMKFRVLDRPSPRPPLALLTLSVPQDFHGCTKPFFIYAQNIMVYNLTAHNYVSLKDNPNKVFIKLKGIGCTI